MANSADLLSKVVGNPDVAEQLADLADERRQRQQTLAPQAGRQQSNDGHRKGHRLLRRHDHRRDRLARRKAEQTARMRHSRKVRSKHHIIDRVMQCHCAGKPSEIMRGCAYMSELPSKYTQPHSKEGRKQQGSFRAHQHQKQPSYNRQSSAQKGHRARQRQAERLQKTVISAQ